MAAAHSAPPRSSLGDSPWFWLGLFTLMGWFVAVAISPRYHLRQPQLEDQFYARQMAGQSIMGSEGPAQPRFGSRLLVPIQPLTWVMGGASLSCWIVLAAQYLRRRDTRNQP